MLYKQNMQSNLKSHGVFFLGIYTYLLDTNLGTIGGWSTHDGIYHLLGHFLNCRHTMTDWWWLEPWNFMTFHLLGMSSSQLTFTQIFFRGVAWTHQPATEHGPFRDEFKLWSLDGPYDVYRWVWVSCRFTVIFQSYVESPEGTTSAFSRSMRSFENGVFFCKPIASLIWIADEQSHTLGRQGFWSHVGSSAVKAAVNDLVSSNAHV